MRFTFAERLCILAMIPGKGDRNTMRAVMQITDMLWPTEQETADFGFSTTPEGSFRWEPKGPDGKPLVAARIDPGAGPDTEYTLTPTQSKVILEALDAMQTAKTITRLHTSLYDKFHPETAPEKAA